jgi:hypothetical protein
MEAVLMAKNRAGVDMQQRKTRNDKKTNVNPALDPDSHRKLKRLSIACDISKTALAGEIIKIVVNHPEWISYFQKKYQASDEFRVIPFRKEDGTLDY